MILRLKMIHQLKTDMVYIYPANRYYNNYLKTVGDILCLRDDLESNADISQFVLYFGKEQVKWEDFYFAFKTIWGYLKYR